MTYFFHIGHTGNNIYYYFLTQLAFSRAPCLSLPFVILFITIYSCTWPIFFIFVTHCLVVFVTHVTYYIYMGQVHYIIYWRGAPWQRGFGHCDCLPIVYLCRCIYMGISPATYCGLGLIWSPRTVGREVFCTFELTQLLSPLISVWSWAASSTTSPPPAVAAPTGWGDFPFISPAYTTLLTK